MYYSPARVLLMALIAAALNLAPQLLIVPAADAVMNYMQIDCFSKQVWSGILYPRWCVDANGGMGSAGPIFYFPLAFYVTALFDPLRMLGMTLEQQYLLGIFLANVVGFLTCTLWLSRIVSMRTALFCSLLFLFGFYRSEAIGRGSYAEYWCISLLPLMFMYVREACISTHRIWPQLSLVITLCMFTHAPVTLIGMMAAGLYILLSNVAAFLPFTMAAGIATLLSLFHYTPMKLLAYTLNDRLGGFSHWRLSWVNSYMNSPTLYEDHVWALMGFLLGVLTMLVVFIAFYRHCAKLSKSDQHEGACWIMVAGIALLMMVSVSKPLWNIIELISGVATPWRMQGLALFALILCLAILTDHRWFQKLRTRGGDMAICAFFFMLSSMFYAGGARPEDLQIHRRLIDGQYTIIYFSTQDIALRYGKVDKFYADFIDRPNRKQAEWISGDGDAQVLQWDADGLVLRGHANHEGVLRLEHFYYPIWKAHYNDQPLAIDVEPVSGRMLLKLPEGDFTLRLTQDYWGMIWQLL